MARYRRRGNFRKSSRRRKSFKRRGKPIRKILISRGGIRL